MKLSVFLPKTLAPRAVQSLEAAPLPAGSREDTRAPGRGLLRVGPDAHGWKPRRGHHPEGNGDADRVGGERKPLPTVLPDHSCQGPPRAVRPLWTQGAQGLSPRRRAAREHSTREPRCRGPCTIAPASQDTPRRWAHRVTQVERSAPWELAEPTASGDCHGRGAPPARAGAPLSAGSGLRCPGAGLGVGGSPQPQSGVAGRPLTRPSLPRAAGILEGTQCSRKSSGPGDSAGS